MEIIAKISKGSVMDQVYIPKNRPGFDIGSYVVIKPVETSEASKKPFFYGIDSIEPIKAHIIELLMQNVESYVECYQNIIITGSFLDNGFCFNDIDIIIVSDKKIDLNFIKKKIESAIGVKTHFIIISNKSFIKGLSTDPLYQTMISKCVSKNRLIYKIKKKINYKVLDLHLLKSNVLIDSYDILNGNEKYYLVRNMVAIGLFMANKKISKDIVDVKIREIFCLKSIGQIKDNTLNKSEFLRQYKSHYARTFGQIMANIKNGTKQK